MSSFCVYQAPCSLFCKILFVQFPSNTAELFQAKLASIWGNPYPYIYIYPYIYTYIYGYIENLALQRFSTDKLDQ